MNGNILADTSFWIALFDPRDQYHREATEKEQWLEGATIVMPWPIMYETVRTRLARRLERILLFDRYLKRPQIVFVDDSLLRDEAYRLAVEYSVNLRRPMSMVDVLCRLLIEDVNTQIDAVLTTNPGDFDDVCRSSRVMLL